MKTVIPVHLDANTVIYIEAQDDREALELVLPEDQTEPEEQRRIGRKGLPDINPISRLKATNPMQMLQQTIRSYTEYSLNAFKDFETATIDEVTLEFGVNLTANSGIPYIATGQAQSSLKITVKCNYNKPANGV